MKSLKVKRFVRKKKPRKRRRKKKNLSLSEAKLHAWSLKVRKRDFYTCYSCGSNKNLHAHHMVSKYYKPEYAFLLLNGVTLCRPCHIGKGGVHCKRELPKNKTIFRLRAIYYSHDIVKSKTIGKKLNDVYSKKSKRSKKVLQKIIRR